MSSKLSKLKRQAKKLQESDSYPSGSPSLGSKDDHSGEPNTIETEQGVNHSRVPKDYDAKGNVQMSGAGKTQVGATVKQVDRQEGATAGKQEVGEEHGTDAADEKAKPVGKDQGVTAGAKEVGEFHDLGGFRQKVRNAFGLPLNDTKNKGNDGLGKNGPSGSPDKNA